eukprot:gene19698-23590_t
MGKKLDQLEARYLGGAKKKGVGALHHDDKQEFETLFKQSLPGTVVAAPTEDDISTEDMEFFASRKSFLKNSFSEDKNLKVSLSKQLKKDGIKQPFTKKRQLREMEATEEEELNDESDASEDDAMESNYNESKRNWKADDIVVKRLPIKMSDGQVKKITEVVINPQVAEVKEKKIEAYPLKPQKLRQIEEQERRKQANLANQQKQAHEQQAIKKQKRVASGEESDSDSEEEEDVDVEGETLVYQSDDEHDSDDDSSGISDSEDEKQKKPKKPMTEAEKYLHTQQAIEKAKLTLGQLSSKIIEDPETNIGLFNDVFAVCITNSEMTIKKFSVLSLCALFKDIIPGYRINSTLDVGGVGGEEKDKKEKVKLSKEIRKTRAYEAKLLRFYQNYLVFIENSIENTLAALSRKKQPRTTAFFKPTATYTPRELSSLLMCIIKSVTTLLVSAPHFNFRTNLVTITTRFSVYRDKEISFVCLKAIRELFLTDTTGGETALEVVRCLSKVAKSCNYMMDPKVLRVFTNIHLTDAIDKVNPFGHASDSRESINSNGKKEKKHMSKKEKQAKKHDAQVEKEMKEADAEYSGKEQKYLQTETLKSIFITYFRIIKNAPHSPALTAVLEGLAKFSHLISVDFLGDLLGVLSGLIDKEGLATLGNALNASITAFKTMKVHGNTLNVDPKEYYFKVYGMLTDLALPREHAQALTAAQALNLMLGERKVTAVERVAAFIKRMSAVSMYLPPHAALTFISLAKTLFVGHPRVQRLVENDSTYTSGDYNAETVDPDHCNPFASTLWELTLFYKHWHPQFEPLVKRFLSFNETSANQVGREKSPFEIYHIYNNSNGGFNPPIQVPKEHPLIAKTKKITSQFKKGKKIVVHFTPSEQYGQSSFMKNMLNKATQNDMTNVSFDSYFQEIQGHEQQMELTQQLKALKTVESKIQELQKKKLAAPAKAAAAVVPQQPKKSKPQPLVSKPVAKLSAKAAAKSAPVAKPSAKPSHKPSATQNNNNKKKNNDHMNVDSKVTKPSKK